uniref:Kazal-like domain-containing protein n=1 Tax=Anguilla anguilla TaxID=7936 RepID=A0A0E9PHD1_ANGAN
MCYYSRYLLFSLIFRLGKAAFCKVRACFVQCIVDESSCSGSMKCSEIKTFIEKRC